MYPEVDWASEISRDFSWGKGGRCVWMTTYHPCSAQTLRKSGALTYPEPLGPPRPVAGHLYFLTFFASNESRELMKSYNAPRNWPIASKFSSFLANKSREPQINFGDDSFNRNRYTDEKVHWSSSKVALIIGRWLPILSILYSICME